MLGRILAPINQSIAHIRSVVSERSGSDQADGGPSLRFWGAVIGGVALGVATAAQVTAGVALHNSLQNAKAIDGIKDSIRKTNQAVEELKTASQKTVLVVSGLQEVINTQIIPSINTLGCQVAANTLGLKLSQYFSELSLIFGPNLRDPAAETLSIQAVAQAFGGDFQTMLSTLGYKGDDLLDVLESQSIRARIILADMEEYTIYLQIEYPTLTTVENAAVQQFNLISFNHDGLEWMPVFPRELLVRANLISNIDTSRCVYTSNSVICLTDTSTPTSLPLYNCATGITKDCIFSPIVNSHISRYAISDGVLFANCLPLGCRCQTTGQTILQEPDASSVMITKEDCAEVYIDGIFIVVGPKKLNRTMFATDYQVGNQVNIDPVDMGSEISQIQSHLNKTEQLINESNDILSKVNPNIVNASTAAFSIVMILLIFAWLVILTLWICCFAKKVRDDSHVYVNNMPPSTVNSLSSLIPTKYNSD